MIPKKNRLQTEKDFAQLFKRGKIFHSSGISGKIAQNKLGLNRFGFVISNKVSKKSVHRNKVRRRLRDIIGRKMEILRQGFDIAIMARQDVLDLTFKELEQSVDHLLDKAGLMPKKVG